MLCYRVFGMVAPMDNLGCSCGLLYRYVVDKEKQMSVEKRLKRKTTVKRGGGTWGRVFKYLYR